VFYFARRSCPVTSRTARLVPHHLVLFPPEDPPKTDALRDKSPKIRYIPGLCLKVAEHNPNSGDLFLHQPLKCVDLSDSFKYTCF
jgi:hypothetical protein